MAVSESQKKASAKWDKNHAATLACKVTKEKAEAFRDYCADQGKSVHAVLLEYVNRCIEK